VGVLTRSAPVAGGRRPAPPTPAGGARGLTRSAPVADPLPDPPPCRGREPRGEFMVSSLLPKSEATKQSMGLEARTGLLRFARNDVGYSHDKGTIRSFDGWAHAF
jgi:hypothetical protein